MLGHELRHAEALADTQVPFNMDISHKGSAQEGAGGGHAAHQAHHGAGHLARTCGGLDAVMISCSSAAIVFKLPRLGGPDGCIRGRK